MTHEEEVEVGGVEDEEEDGEENGEAGPEEGSHEEKILKKNDEKSGEKADHLKRDKSSSPEKAGPGSCR